MCATFEVNPPKKGTGRELTCPYWDECKKCTKIMEIACIFFKPSTFCGALVQENFKTEKNY